MALTQNCRFLLGICVLLLVDLIWVGSSELSKYIFDESGFKKPFFTCYLKNSMFALYLLGFIFYKPWHRQCSSKEEQFYQPIDWTPTDMRETSSLGEPCYEPLNHAETEKSSDADSDEPSTRSVHFSQMAEVRHLAETEAVEAMMSRLSFSASIRAEEIVKNATNKFHITKVVRIAFIFCILWFVGNYSYQVALVYTEAGIINVISSLSGLFTLFLAGVFPSSSLDRFTLSKFISVLFMVAGMVFVCLEDIKYESTSLPLGIFWAFLGAILYACYMVFLKRKVPSEGNMDLTMFFGFVGAFNAVLLSPLFTIFHITGWETFEWPSNWQLLYIVINGLIGTVLSEILWLWGCFLTSSLMATLSLSLTIPLTMAFDMILRNVTYSLRYYCALIPIVFSFVFITFLTHYENKDPVMDILKKIGSKCRRRSTRDYRVLPVDCNEDEHLIVDESHDEAELNILDGEEINSEEHLIER